MHKSVALLAALLIAAILNVVGAASPASLKQQFQDFKIKYNKKYASADEESQRFVTFAANMKRAAQMQAMNPLATFGVNAFSDVPADEFKRTHHNAEKHYAAAVARQAKEPHVAPDAKIGADRQIDWRKRGAVTYVKNQGQCGSCWSFSTTGGIEGQWFLAGHTLVAISEQEFVSCDTIDSGCQGGLMDNAYTWVLQAHNGSIVTEESYPYVSGDGYVPPCSMHGTKFGAQIYGYENVAHDENTMGSWVYENGPLSVAVDATSWQTYTGGILSNCISQQLDHGVLIVGFDDVYSTNYWWVKNSWGKSWGEEGYIRIEKGTNQCLINNYPCSAKVHKNGPTPPPSPPSKKEFTQRKCKDPLCKDCVDLIFPQDECITGSKYSYKASCHSDGLKVQSFSGRSCHGSPIADVKNEVGKCSIAFDNKHEENFVENVCHAGPAPTTAPTAAPPTAAPPAPTGQNFIQMDCSDSACSQGCQNYTFPADKCLPLSGGGSAKAHCTPDALVMTEYPVSTDCTGFAIPSSMPLDQCLQNGDGQGYFENFCTPAGSFQLGERVLSTRAKRA